jgi:SAM-dependent methyltransferase
MRSEKRTRAARWLRGSGLEIGALHNPLLVPDGVEVRYVDRTTEAELRHQYPELENEALVPTSIIGDAEDLSPVADGSVDFVIANHLIEHLENPIKGLVEMTRVLRPGGILYVALPDPRVTFDRDRPLTSIEHVVQEYRAGTASTREAHFAEWVEKVEPLTPGPYGGGVALTGAARVQQLLDLNYSIHFHVWRAETFLEVLVEARQLAGVELELLEFTACDSGADDEYIFVLRKGFSATPAKFPPLPSEVEAQRLREEVARLTAERDVVTQQHAASEPYEESSRRAAATPQTTTVPVDKSLVLIDVRTMRGLEIGALHRPRVRKTDGPIFYVDHYTTDELRERYSANEQTRPHLAEIVEVDFVIKGDRSLSDVAGEQAPFDYVIASHLIEHVPDPVGWLQDVARLLRPRGVVSLVVPDKRFCFDVNRVETQPRDWIEWHLRRLTVPTFSQLFDFFANVVTIDGSVDTAGLWAGAATYAGVRRRDVPDADKAAYEMCLQQQRTGEYFDVHGAVYTPRSFLALMELTARLGLHDFELGEFFPTEVNTLEFFASLRRLEDGARGSAAQLESFRSRLGVQEEWDHAGELDRERGRRVQAEAALAAMAGSRSWRVTAPLRAAARVAREARSRRG